MNKKTILYITELFPYPPTSGAKIKSLNTIQTLSKEFNILLVCFNQDQVAENHLNYISKFVKDIKIFPLSNLNTPPQDNISQLTKNYLRLKPYFLYQFYSSTARIYINELIQKVRPDIIHIDHINMAQYLPTKKEQVWILEEHNVEHQLAWTKFVYFPGIKKTKLHLLIEYLLIYLFEKRTYKKFDHIFTISNHDKKMLKDKFCLKRISTQTLVYKNQPPVNRNNNNKSILFIGDISWIPNKLAIRWFIKEIFPQILKEEPKTIFNIVGEIEDNFLNEIKMLNKSHLNQSIKIHGFQKNIDKYLAESYIFILPFQVGGGVRIKALTSLSQGLPIVSTRIGVQGLKLKKNLDYLHADTKNEFIKKVLLILKNKLIAQILSKRSHKYIKKFHSEKNNHRFLKKYIKLFKNINNSRFSNNFWEM